MKSWALVYITSISVQFPIAQQYILFTQGKNNHYTKNPSYITVVINLFFSSFQSVFWLLCNCYTFKTLTIKKPHCNSVKMNTGSVVGCLLLSVRRLWRCMGVHAKSCRSKIRFSVHSAFYFLIQMLSIFSSNL